MYCILVTGIPASGKSTMAEFLAERLRLPMLSKDKIKEILFDDVGFASRSEKVALGISAMNILYYTARQLMKCGRPFILENNFENISREGILFLLQKYSYHAVTVVLTGNYEIIYQRFLARNESPRQHRQGITADKTFSRKAVASCGSLFCFRSGTFRTFRPKKPGRNTRNIKNGQTSHRIAYFAIFVKN